MGITVTSIPNDKLPKTPKGIKEMQALGMVKGGGDFIAGGGIVGEDLANAAKEMSLSIEKGTLNQNQANQIAQQYFLSVKTPPKPNEKRGNPQKYLDQLKKSGYGYKEVPAHEFGGGGVLQFIPAHGEAVKISSGESGYSNGKPLGETTDTTTGNQTTEEGFFAKHTTAIIVVGCFALAGTAYYFYTQKKK